MLAERAEAGRVTHIWLWLALGILSAIVLPIVAVLWLAGLIG